MSATICSNFHGCTVQSNITSSITVWHGQGIAQGSAVEKDIDKSSKYEEKVFLLKWRPMFEMVQNITEVGHLV